MRDPPRHTRACGIASVDPHAATLACPPLREEESSEALERTFLPLGPGIFLPTWPDWRRVHFMALVPYRVRTSEGRWP